MGCVAMTDGVYTARIVGEPLGGGDALGQGDAEEPASDLVGHLDRVFAARTIEEVWQLHCARMAAYGFDRLLYACTRFPGSRGFGDPEDALVIANMPAAYMKYYIDDGGFRHCPIVDWLSRNEGLLNWGDVYEWYLRGELRPAHRHAVERQAEFGMLHGFSIGFPARAPRTMAAIAICARDGLDQDDADAIWQAHERELMVINAAAHMCMSSLPQIGCGRQLTARQREVLQWVGEGKTVQDTATILGVTSATVEKHLRLAREALDVQTTPQAVLKAAFRNQLYVLAPAEPVQRRRARRWQHVRPG